MPTDGGEADAEAPASAEEAEAPATDAPEGEERGPRRRGRRGGRRRREGEPAAEAVEETAETAPASVTSSPSRIQVTPRATTTSVWKRDQRRRSSRAGTSVAMTGCSFPSGGACCTVAPDRNGALAAL